VKESADQLFPVYDPSEKVVSYDAVFKTINDWAVARQSNLDYTSSAKAPVVPFEPLTREIGVSPLDSIETVEVTPEFQQKVSNWVGKVKKPYDLIQRAEGFETPGMVYQGAQNRAAKNQETPLERAIVRSKAGRAAIRRQYDTTLLHYTTAHDRVVDAGAALTKLKNGQELAADDRVVFGEILQELANGLAANLDNKYPGTDKEARIAGNSILRIAQGIQAESAIVLPYKNLLHAAVGYVKKQEKLWDAKLTSIYNFAADKEFAVGEQSEDNA
jgi:hypothetical protein